MRAFALLLISALALTLHCTGTPIYSVVNLGSTGGSISTAVAISEAGMAAGFGRTPGGADAGFTSSGVLNLLGTRTQAQDINSNGDVIGTDFSSGGPVATVWQGGIANAILSTPSFGLGVNESGDIVGSYLAGMQMRSFLQSGGVTSSIPTSGNWSAANDVNAYRKVVGTYGLANGSFMAYSWTQAAGVRSVGTLGGASSYGQAVNDDGFIAGSSLVAGGNLHAFLDDGSMRDLGTLGGNTSAANDINAAGHVVGYSTDAAGQSRAFVWMNGTMFDLNTLLEPTEGWSLEAAFGINSFGQIVGTGKYQGQTTAFRLDPLLSPDPADGQGDSPDSLSAPEPASIGLFSAGLLAVLLRKRITGRK